MGGIGGNLQKKKTYKKILKIGVYFLELIYKKILWIIL